jgi:DNA-binding NarL/FixJ family response regulator
LCKDDAESGECLNDLLKIFKGINFVGVIYNGEAILSEIIDLQPNVIIMDVEMPGYSGIDCTRRIKEQFPDIHVLFYTVYEEEHKLFGALRAGACGYLLKRSSASLLKEAFQKLC